MDRAGTPHTGGACAERVSAQVEGEMVAGASEYCASTYRISSKMTLPRCGQSVAVARGKVFMLAPAVPAVSICTKHSSNVAICPMSVIVWLVASLKLRF